MRVYDREALRDHSAHSRRLCSIDQISRAIDPQAIIRREVRGREIGELMNDDTRICLAHGRDQCGAMKDIDNDRVGSDRLYLSGFPGIAGRAENFVPCLDQHREELSADGAGRVCACEVLVPTPAIRNLIREGKTHQIYSAIQTGSQVGMQTMDASLSALVKHGVISRSLAEERSSNPEELRRLIGGGAPAMAA